MLLCVFGLWARFQPSNFPLQLRSLACLMYFDTSNLVYNTREKMPVVNVRPTLTSLQDVQRHFSSIYSIHLFSESLLLLNSSSSVVRVTEWRNKPAVLSSLMKLYRMYEACARDLTAAVTNQFDHVLRVREDSFFFFDRVDLASIARRRDCDVIHNDCQTWGGLNNRWQLIRSHASAAYLASHVRFVDRIRVYRSEEYEKRAAYLLRLKTCVVSPHVVGHAITRTLNDTHVCIRRHETNCIPCNATVRSCANNGIYTRRTLRSMCGQ